MKEEYNHNLSASVDRCLAREVHPDAAGGGGDEGFIRLHAAYATLADPNERARYDRDVACRAAGMMMQIGRASCRERV